MLEVSYRPPKVRVDPVAAPLTRLTQDNHDLADLVSLEISRPQRHDEVLHGAVYAADNNMVPDTLIILHI